MLEKEEVAALISIQYAGCVQLGWSKYTHKHAKPGTAIIIGAHTGKPYTLHVDIRDKYLRCKHTDH